MDTLRDIALAAMAFRTDHLLQSPQKSNSSERRSSHLT